MYPDLNDPSVSFFWLLCFLSVLFFPLLQMSVFFLNLFSLPSLPLCSDGRHLIMILLCYLLVLARSPKLEHGVLALGTEWVLNRKDRDRSSVSVQIIRTIRDRGYHWSFFASSSGDAQRGQRSRVRALERENPRNRAGISVTL